MMRSVGALMGLMILESATLGLQAQDLAEFTWLSGDWAAPFGTTTITESWTIENDSTLIGSSQTLENDSVTFEEALRIKLRHDSIQYIALLPSKTAVFGLEHQDGKGFSVIDPKNDFPSRIIYQKTEDGMSITLEGKDNKHVMDFVRKKP